MHKYTAIGRFSYALCIILAIITYALLKYNLAYLSLVISLFILIGCVVNLRVGLFFWFIVAPLSSLISGQIESVPVLFTPSFLIGYIINRSVRKRTLSTDVNTLYLYLYIIAVTLLATLYYQYNNTLNVVIAFVFMLLMNYVVIICYTHYHDLHKGIAFCLLLSGIVAILIAVDGIGSRRLDVEGSVRQLSNVLSFSSLFIVLCLFVYKKTLSFNYRLLLTIGVIPLVLGLILTVSRGSIFAFFGAAGLSILFYFLKKGSIKTVLSVLFYFCTLIVVIYFFAFDYIENNFGNYFRVLEERFEQDALSSGAGIRQYIWQRVLESYNSVELFFGTGLDGFRAKAAKLNIYYYSHSVFIDVIATCGVLVLVVFSLYLINNAVRAIRKGDVIAIGLIIFSILNFSTHGAITSSLFWMSIGLARGSILRRLE